MPGNGFLGVEVVVGDDVVEAGADESGRHDKEQRVEGQGAVVAFALQLPSGEPGGDDDA
ncbi:MAG: hypothetical protein WKF53_06490 [Rubrobacter sp.]